MTTIESKPNIDLMPGDLCIYTGHDLVDTLITIKTWSKFCHTENYIGGGFSVASRNFVGVNKYPVRWEGLCAVYRPVEKFDLDAALQWFYSNAQGQKYDLVGVTLGFNFASWQANPSRQWCSEFSTNFLRAGGCEPFRPELVADRVAPASYGYSSPKVLELIYSV